MNYPSDLCQLVIRNMEILEEAPKVCEHVEERLFQAINARMEKRLNARGGWKGCYELVTGKDDDTSFAPENWPENEDNGDYSAYFRLYCTDAGDNLEWLSSALGLANSALCLQFWVEQDFTGLATKEHKKIVQDFYSSTPALAKAGFLIAKNSVIYRPFSFDAEKVAEEYPDFDDALKPLDAALADLFEVAGEFDKFVGKFK